MQEMRLDSIMGDLRSPEKKSWFAWAIAGMVMADDKMSKAEEKYIRELFLQHDDPEVTSAIAQAMKKNTKIQLNSLVLEDRALATRILKYLLMIAALDEEIPKAERDYLKEIGEKLGFSEDAVMLAVAWRKRELVRQADAEKDENQITIQLRKETPQYKQLETY